MLNRSASLAMSTSILKALPGKLDIKRHSPSILYKFNVSNRANYDEMYVMQHLDQCCLKISVTIMNQLAVYFCLFLIDHLGTVIACSGWLYTDPFDRIYTEIPCPY